MRGGTDLARGRLAEPLARRVKAHRALLVRELPSCTASSRCSGARRTPFDPFPGKARVLRWGVGCSIVHDDVDLVVRNDTTSTFQLLERSRALVGYEPSAPVIDLGPAQRRDGMTS